MRIPSSHRFLLYACLLFAIALLMIKPFVSIAATGTAKCAGHDDVSCSAVRCDCQDNVGCTGYDENGHVIESQSPQCPSDLIN
jgi:hypothetical protein